MTLQALQRLSRQADLHMVLPFPRSRARCARVLSTDTCFSGDVTGDPSISSRASMP